jgi:2-phosphosulfolactate phosphatase
MSQILAEWGMAGVNALHGHVSVLIIVDVLSFSTAVDIAVGRGAIVYPFAFTEPEAAQRAASQVDAVLAYPRRAAGGQFSLSPASLTGIPSGMRLMLPSPNGSRLSFAASRTRNHVHVLAGCLRNAAAVAMEARSLAKTGSIGVIPAGETWPDGSLRPAVEDFLGAGAIIDRLDLPCSPEAQIARDAYRAAGREVDSMIRLCVSGRELVDRGFSGDVDLALEQGASTTAPRLTDGAYRPTSL